MLVSRKLGRANIGSSLRYGRRYVHQPARTSSRCHRLTPCRSTSSSSMVRFPEGPSDSPWEQLKTYMQGALACLLTYCNEYSALMNRQAQSFLLELSAAVEQKLQAQQAQEFLLGLSSTFEKKLQDRQALLLELSSSVEKQLQDRQAMLVALGSAVEQKLQHRQALLLELGSAVEKSLQAQQQAHAFFTDLGSVFEKFQSSWERQASMPPLPRIFYATCPAQHGAGFRESMVAAVEQVVGTVHLECIEEIEVVHAPGQALDPEDGVLPAGQYLWVRIGPVWVKDDFQVMQIYSRMREDERCEHYTCYEDAFTLPW